MSLRIGLKIAFFCSVSLLLISTVSLPVRADETEDVVELQHLEDQRRAAFGTVNALNPLSPDFKGLSEKQRQQLAPFDQVLKNKVTQKVMRGLASPTIAGAVKQVFSTPYSNYIVITQIAWLFFFFVFKLWRLSKLGAGQWWRATLFRMSSNLMYLSVSMYLIPWFFLGESYNQLISSVYYTMLR